MNLWKFLYLLLCASLLAGAIYFLAAASSLRPDPNPTAGLCCPPPHRGEKLRP